LTTDQGGYHVYRRKAPKSKQGKDDKTQPAKHGKRAVSIPHQAAQKTAKSNKGAKGQTPKPPNFASSNKARAWGRLSELAEAKSESDDDDDESVADGHDETPYAYEPVAATRDSTTRETAGTPTMGVQGTAPGDGVDGMTMDVDEEAISEVFGYVGSSPPS
jgi:hypothetical protein